MPERTWRTRPAARVAGLAVTGMWAALAGLITADGDNAAVPILLWSCALLIGVGTWRMAFVPSVTALASAIVVRNPLSHQQIQYSEVSDVQPGYYGLRIVRRDGSLVHAWAVQKSNASQWSSQITRADDVARCLMRRVMGAAADRRTDGA